MFSLKSLLFVKHSSALKNHDFSTAHYTLSEAQSGWSDFWKKHETLCHAVPNCFRTPIPKFNTLLLLFKTCRRASAFLEWYPKISKHLKTSFFNLAPGGNIFFDFLKQKTVKQICLWIVLFWLLFFEEKGIISNF